MRSPLQPLNQMRLQSHTRTHTRAHTQTHTYTHYLSHTDTNLKSSLSQNKLDFHYLNFPTSSLSKSYLTRLDFHTKPLLNFVSIPPFPGVFIFTIWSLLLSLLRIHLNSKEKGAVFSSNEQHTTYVSNVARRGF